MHRAATVLLSICLTLLLYSCAAVDTKNLPSDLADEQTAIVVTDPAKPANEQTTTSKIGAPAPPVNHPTSADTDSTLLTKQLPASETAASLPPTDDSTPTDLDVVDERSRSGNSDKIQRAAVGVAGAVISVAVGVVIVKEFIEDVIIPTVVGLVVAGLLINAAND